MSLTDQQFRNAQWRGEIKRRLERAPDSVRDEVHGIASEQLPPARDDAAETLERIYDNLRKRADALIRAGLATAADFIR